MVDPLKFCCFQVLGKPPFSCLFSLLLNPRFWTGRWPFLLGEICSSQHSGNHPGLQRCSFPCAHLHSHGHGRRFAAGLAEAASAAGPLYAALENLGVTVGHQRCVSLTPEALVLGHQFSVQLRFQNFQCPHSVDDYKKLHHPIYLGLSSQDHWFDK